MICDCLSMWECVKFLCHPFGWMFHHPNNWKLSLHSIHWIQYYPHLQWTFFILTWLFRSTIHSTNKPASFMRYLNFQTPLHSLTNGSKLAGLYFQFCGFDLYDDTIHQPKRIRWKHFWFSLSLSIEFLFHIWSHRWLLRACG